MKVIWYLSCNRDISQIDLYNNSPNNAIVNAASTISYRSLLEADVFAVLFKNELKNLANVVIGKLGKLVHKQNCSHDFFFYFINYGIIIVQAKYNVHYCWQQKKLSVLDITGFFFRIRTQVKVLVLSDAISNTNRFNSTVSYT